ncbi:MAG: methyltransferase domain-containing protein [Burkholderiales bacterium]
MVHHNLKDWFETPLGAYVARWEQAYFDEVVADIFGFNALQYGMTEHDFLHASRMQLKFSAGTEASAKIRAVGDALPVATQSMDLVVLPHVLEFADEPHQILREVDRVMMPEGRLIIVGFNPWSLWGLRQTFSAADGAYPWCGRFVSLVRLKDWLSLLGFDVSAGRLACYAPPFAKEKWLARFDFMEQAGDRWWGVAGGIYMLQAIKRVQGMRLITPKWATRPTAKGMAQAAQRAARVGAAMPDNVIPLRKE